MSYRDAKASITVQDNKYKMVLFVFAVFIVILSTVYKRSTDLASNPTGLYVVVGLLVAVMAAVYANHRLQTIRVAKLLRFAKDNNLEALHNSVSAQREGLLFNDGWERRVQAAFMVPTEKGDIEYGVYRYVTGRGRSARTRRYTYIAMPHSFTTPTVFFDSRKNQGVPFFSRNHVVFIDKSQKVVSVASNAFAVYAPKSFHQHVADALNQGGMYDLERLNGVYDIEITPSAIVAFRRGQADMSKRSDIERLLQDGELIQTFIDRWIGKLEVPVGSAEAQHEALNLMPRKPMLLYVILGIIAIGIILSIVMR
jgi:hypothetical protein